MSQIFRIGVVGAGAVASSVHLPILTRRSDLFSVTSIVDINFEAANSLADRFNIKYRFNSPSEMYASNQIDAVFVLNSGSHSQLVVAALKANLDVFCEKPLAYTLEEMAEIESALLKSGKKLMIGYMKTYDQAILEATKNISGRPRTVDVLVLHPSGESQLATTDAHVKSFKPSRETIAKFKASNDQICERALGPAAASAFGEEFLDIILGSIIHELSVLRSLNLKITNIDYVDRWPRDNKAESFIIHARTDDGVRITIRWFYLDSYPKYQEEIRWVSESEGHHILFSSPYILRVPTKYIHTTRQGLDHKETIFQSYQPNFEIELVAFNTLLSTGHQQTDPISAGKEDLEICLEIARAICIKEKIEMGGNLI